MTIFIAVYRCELSIFCLINFSHSGGNVVVLSYGLFFLFLLNYTMYTGITCFISLHFVVHCRYCVFLQIEGLCQASLLGLFFQIYWDFLLALCLHVTFGNSCNISDFFFINLFIMVISDL